MLEIKQALLLTIVYCRLCRGERRIHVFDNKRGGIVAQLGECERCGAGSDQQLSPVDNNLPTRFGDPNDDRKPAPTFDGSRPPSVVTFQRSPSPPAPPEPVICRSCRMDPCFFTRLEPEIIQHDTAVNNSLGRPTVPMAGVVQNRERRTRAFRFVSYRMLEELGPGRRRKMPSCIDEGVRCLFPAYVGLHNMGNQATYP